MKTYNSTLPAHKQDFIKKFVKECEKDLENGEYLKKFWEYVKKERK